MLTSIFLELGIFNSIMLHGVKAMHVKKNLSVRIVCAYRRMPLTQAETMYNMTVHQCIKVSTNQILERETDALCYYCLPILL